jgi:hypothetical protein
MAPNKFEKHIKKELQEREIQPSANAWESLSERLDADLPKSKKRDYFWYGIAASIIGLLIISVLYFSPQNNANTPEVQFVETNEEIKEAVPYKDVITEHVEESVVENNLKNDTPKEHEIPTIENSITEIENQVVIADKTESNDFENSLDAKSTGPEQEVINIKVLEIVAAVDSIEQNNSALTDAEVEELLRNAQEEILREKLFKSNGTIDAMALLTEVEDELDKSFRDQIFESLKTGFLKVRTAVADRNK